MDDIKEVVGILKKVDVRERVTRLEFNVEGRSMWMSAFDKIADVFSSVPVDGQEVRGDHRYRVGYSESTYMAKDGTNRTSSTIKKVQPVSTETTNEAQPGPTSVPGSQGLEYKPSELYSKDLHIARQTASKVATDGAQGKTFESEEEEWKYLEKRAQLWVDFYSNGKKPDPVKEEDIFDESDSAPAEMF